MKGTKVSLYYQIIANMLLKYLNNIVIRINEVNHIGVPSHSQIGFSLLPHRIINHPST